MAPIYIRIYPIDVWSFLCFSNSIPMKTNLLCFTLFVPVLTLGGCTSTKSPEVVTEHFWQAIQAGNEGNVRAVSTKASENIVDLSNSRWRNIKVAFGETRIRGVDAQVETTAIFSESGSQSAENFNTVLKKEYGEWKVDYPETMAGIENNDPLFRIQKQLEKFGIEFSNKFDSTISEIQKDLPKHQKEIEEMGNTLLKELEQSLEHELPKVQKLLENLKDSFDKALEETLRKKRENEKQRKSPVTTI